MRSRALQLVLSAIAAAAVIAAALFVSISEQHIAAARTAERAFDAVVRETTSSVAEFRTDGVSKSLDALRAMATTDQARASLDQATAKARDFTEIAAVLDDVYGARLAELQAADAAEAAQRRLEAAALGGTAIIGLLAIAGVLIATPVIAATPAQADAPAGETAAVSTLPADLAHRSEPEMTPGYLPSRPAGPVLRAASLLCTDLGRVSDVEELRELVGRAAGMMDASGLIVWTGAADGSQLFPSLSHGYAPDLMSRLPPLARSADNAAATAYRTGQLQIVLARPGASSGAIVAPVLSPAGCVGVISAEIRGGGETSEGVQALAAIFAAQLAGVLHTTPQAHERRAASG
jgi:hypothetical protein